MLGVGRGWKVSEVTTPKLPAHAPRSAQNRSGRVVLVAGDHAPVGQDHLRSKHEVKGEAVGASQDVMAAAEGEAADGDR